MQKKYCNLAIQTLVMLSALLFLNLASPLSAWAGDDFYNAPYYNAQVTYLALLGTQSQLVAASENYLVWFGRTDQPAAPLTGYDRLNNKMLNLGNASTSTALRPVLTGNSLYFLNADQTRLISYDLANNKQTEVVNRSTGISQFVVTTNYVVFSADNKLTIHPLNNAAETNIEVTTPTVEQLVGTDNMLFWHSSTVTDNSQPEYVLIAYDLVAGTSRELMRAGTNFLSVAVSGTRLIYTSTDPKKNNAVNITSYDYASSTYFEVGPGGSVSVNGDLLTYLNQNTSGQLIGYDMVTQRQFLVSSSANEAFITGKKIIWSRSFTNRLSTGKAYYETLLLPSLEQAKLPSNRINEAIPATLFFYDTGHSLRGFFRDYWENHGALSQFGLPLTEEYDELNPIDKKVYRVQYFERARFEYHPENLPPYNVLLGLLARQISVGREFEDPFLAVTPPDKANSSGKLFFSDTGHTLTGSIRKYWEKTGGLAVYGFPISEEFMEVNQADGKTYLVQYFERSRLEFHPENTGSIYEVQLGLLGTQILAGRGWLN